MQDGPKTLHHFVPKFYLQAWAPDGQVFCLQNGKIGSRGLTKVGAENYFYSLTNITSEDEQFIEELLIKQSPDGLKESHRILLHTFSLPHKVKRMLEEKKRQAERAGKAVDEEDFDQRIEFLDRQIVELNENYHTSIEHLFQPILKDMKAGDLNFAGEPEKRFAFYFGLSVQYSRTNHIKACREQMSEEKFEYYLRLANLITHMVATNVGHSLMATHEAQHIVLLDNATKIPFVTADQPVINLSASPKNFDPPPKFELYYPLSPTKAMLLLERDSSLEPSSSAVSELQAHYYNLLMAAHSFRQVYSNSRGELEAIQAGLPPFVDSL
jgi:hypothetical protein